MTIWNESAQAREIGAITAEIWELRQQAQIMALRYAVEIGRRLDEAKRTLKHGEWGDWLQNEVEFSKSSAYNFMKLYYEYGSCEALLSGEESNFQSIGNLPYSKALLLLAVPAEEREEFAQEVHADKLSAPELKRVIADREMRKHLSNSNDSAKYQYSETIAKRLPEAEDGSLHNPSDPEPFKTIVEKVFEEACRESLSGDSKAEEKRRKELREEEIEMCIRITCLIPEFHPLVNEGKISLVTGSALSYLSDTAQRLVLCSINEHGPYPTLDQATRLLGLYVKGKLTKEKIDEILAEKDPEKMKAAYKKLLPYIPERIPDTQIEDYIVKALKAYGTN